MLLFLVQSLYATELSPIETEPRSAISIVEDQTPIVLAQLQARKEWLLLLYRISTIADFTCQFAQIALTLPQLTVPLSEEQGVWLNSFNLTTGIIAITQIPTKKWIQTRLTETEQAIRQAS